MDFILKIEGTPLNVPSIFILLYIISSKIYFEVYVMTKRKYIPKKIREAVYNKYNGHCAYCGKKIEYKDMQLDHLIPVQRERFKRFSEEEIECFENYFPACRRCNHAKRAYSLEGFREFIETIPKKLFRDNYIYKVGLDYGLVEAHEHKIKFYFEQAEESKNVKKENF